MTGKSTDRERSYDHTRYYGQIHRIFDSFPDEAAQRAYVAAILQCFDSKNGSPESPGRIASAHGFRAQKLHEFRFVLAKNHARQFFVDEASFPGVSVRDIRGTTVKGYRSAFRREPFVRGRSSYWLSAAEWMVLLELRGDLPLPSRLAKFANRHNLI